MTSTYSCNNCAKCCANYGEINIYPNEALKVAQAIKKHPLDFAYYSDDSHLFIKKRHDCFFLDKGKCALHELNVKPYTCWSFPNEYALDDRKKGLVISFRKRVDCEGDSNNLNQADIEARVIENTKQKVVQLHIRSIAHGTPLKFEEYMKKFNKLFDKIDLETAKLALNRMRNFEPLDHILL
ncbi:YkgJ family cysteine cluster protein [Candidatus Woesearchaeota archaeon]|nr:YkgJ family cysteine cluster protein [Candidatus Woesearchaeota archaeon]